MPQRLFLKALFVHGWRGFRGRFAHGKIFKDPRLSVQSVKSVYKKEVEVT